MPVNNFVMWANTVNAINSFVIGAVSSVSLIIVFYKNRKKEPVIPLTWIFEIVGLDQYGFPGLRYGHGN